PSSVVARQARWQRDIWGLFLSINKPLIAALHGFVLGSGIEMSLCCDIRLAADDAIFGLPEVALGILPAAGGSQTLSRLIGQAPALEVLLTGRWIDAEEAQRLKLVNRVVSRVDLLTVAEEMADTIQSYRPLAVNYAKQAVTRGLDLSLDKGLELESNLADYLSASTN
ncbi:MAG: enoyl-CoA hydratase-related protein, partial [Dehalococcoidales bacterium]|nr:enoyl-CoA hydratase-related protein [Dehalococcoidales bacterium]